MSFYDAIRVGASGAAEDFEIERSIRNDQGTADVNNGSNFEKTYSSAGNRKTFTISVWAKKCNTPGNIGDGDDGYSIFTTGGGGSGAQSGNFGWTQPNDKLYFLSQPQPSPNAQLITNRLFRDYGAWYHLVVAVDTTQATASNRVKIYVNGVQETSFSTETYPSQNDDLQFNHAVRHRIGSNSLGSDLNSTYANLNGYLADFNFIDGLQLTPASFGETKVTTGQWIPIDTEGLTFGSNGFRLEFKDNSATTATTLGKDTSGNSNNFTPNGYSVSAGVGNDSVTDTPTNNFAILNQLDLGGGAKLVNGNLDLSTSGAGGARATFGMSSGKYYAECTFGNATGTVGITKGGTPISSFLGNSAGEYSYGQNGNKINGDDGSQTGYGDTFTSGDTIGIAFDADGGNLYFYKNGSLQASGTAAFTGLTDGPYFFAFGNNVTTSTCSFNFGQRTFANTIPTGYKALNSANLPDPTIKLPNKHFDTLLYTGNAGSQTISGLNFSPDWVWGKGRDLVSHHFLADTIRGVGRTLRSDANATAEIDNTGSPKFSGFTSNGFSLNTSDDQFNGNSNTYVAWNWDAGETDSATYRVVVVSDSGNKYRFRNSANSATFAQSAVTLDLAEGGTYIFNMDDSTNASHPFSIGTAANGTVYTSGITYFLDGVSKTYSEYTSGFSSASTRRLHITVPASAPQLYYWCSIHSGMGGAINTNSTLGSSNFDGSNQTTVKANTTSGFSIVTWTGTGSVASMGHGLGVAPNTVIIKTRSNSTNWVVYHQSTGISKYLHLSTTDAAPSASNYFADDSGNGPSSTIFYGRSDGNTSSQTMVAYCFSEVAGYSKFGKYTGNGSTNGPFVNLGFRPAWVMWKNADASTVWIIFDAVRETFNFLDAQLRPNETSTENSAGASYSMDFLSNGFKVRSSDSNFNGNGNNIIYWAFAESPFKNSRAR